MKDDGTLGPVLKRARSSPPGPPRPPVSINISDPTSVMDWPPSPPLVLSEQQSNDLGTYLARDSKRLEEVGFETLVNERRKRSDFSPRVCELRHKAARLLDHIRKRGVSVALQSAPLTEGELDESMARGPHKSATEYKEFLREELLDFVRKGFWMILPYRLLK